MITSSNTTEGPDELERGSLGLKKLYHNWGTLLTSAFVLVLGGIYVFVFLVSQVTTDRGFVFSLHLTPFLVALVLLLWSFSVTLLTPPRPVPLRYKLTDGEWDALEQLVDSPVDQQDFMARLVIDKQIQLLQCTGPINVCRPCRQLKPDRTHHCRRCRTCVMRMDHHCPWFNNCIHFHNYRSFFCTLFYSTVIFAHVVVTVLWFYTVEMEWELTKLYLPEAVLTAVAISFLCGLVIGCFFAYHVFLSCCNRTHIENLTPELKRVYSLGSVCKNFREVHGPFLLCWLPIQLSDNDGCTFRTKKAATSSREHAKPPFNQKGTVIAAKFGDVRVQIQPLPSTAEKPASDRALKNLLRP